MQDLNAVDNPSVKLRHPETNTKIPRSPYNIEGAIAVLFQELLDLDGEDSAYRVMADLTQVFAREKGWTTRTHDHMIAAAMEMVVNMPLGDNIDPTQLGALIVSELKDMELIEA